ncbi:tail assembly protein [Lonepinella sp. BR2930]|uniref:tail assembly protein n=1 Tax=Lonepinella sp. BR2930 TaxID=3434554 RepID=UPI003F6E010B
MNGLLTQIQGLRQYLMKGYYKVRIGKNRYLTEDQIKTNPCITLDEQTAVHFTPVLSGAGKGLGIGQIILGVALIAVAWWNPLSWAATTTMMVGAMGGSLLLGGTMSLLTKTPNMSSGSGDSEKQQSTSFSNIKNLTPQGKPIPLLYGKMLTSLVLVSQGIETFDDMENSTAKDTPKQGALQGKMSSLSHS